VLTGGRHVRRDHGSLNDNHSAGNITGGITTIQEKSLGAVAKAGASPLSAAYATLNPHTQNASCSWTRLVFYPMWEKGPGNSGANLIPLRAVAASTFGCKSVRFLKLPTNIDTCSVANKQRTISQTNDLLLIASQIEYMSVILH
jgi:altronate hydrolase